MKTKMIPGPDHPITVTLPPARVTVALDGHLLADTTSALTLQEAAYPAVQYIPLADVDPAVLKASDHTSYCPFKGDASYYDLHVGDKVIENAVWTYTEPYEAVAAIRGHVAFYPDRVDAVEVRA